MQSTQQLNESSFAVVRLSLGAAALVLGVRIVFAGLQGLLNVWVALTPGQDRQWNVHRSRV